MIQFNNVVANRLASYYSNVQYSFYIYGGTIPTVNDAYLFNPGNYTSLAFLTGVYLTSTGSKVSLTSTGGVPFKGVNTGTATWFFAYTGTTETGIIGTISSDPATKAPMLLDNVNIVPTTTATFNIVDFAFNFTL